MSNFIDETLTTATSTTTASTSSTVTSNIKSWPSNGFLAALFCILVSELGDKTFVITTILAMKYSKRSVFLGALTAATLMISLSVMIGAMSSLVPAVLTHHFSILLFAFFGYQMLNEGLSMESKASPSPSSSSSSRTGKSSSNRRESTDEVEKEALSAISHLESKQSSKLVSKYIPFVSLIFIETFTLNFFAEWGDKSQLATILLAAKDNVIGVASGAIFGQAICITLAVIGGQLISKIVSIRTVTIIGGIGFVAFAVLEFLF